MNVHWRCYVLRRLAARGRVPPKGARRQTQTQDWPPWIEHANMCVRWRDVKERGSGGSTCMCGDAQGRRSLDGGHAPPASRLDRVEPPPHSDSTARARGLPTQARSFIGGSQPVVEPPATGVPSARIKNHMGGGGRREGSIDRLLDRTRHLTPFPQTATAVLPWNKSTHAGGDGEVSEV